jgi:hypothetical protein
VVWMTLHPFFGSSVAKASGTDYYREDQVRPPGRDEGRGEELGRSGVEAAEL